MRATLWIQHDEDARIPLKEISVPVVDLKRPVATLSVVVTVPPILAAKIWTHVVLAQFTLFHMEGWSPNIQAHYRLSSFPPNGWMWIVHPDAHTLILSRSLHPAE